MQAFVDRRKEGKTVRKKWFERTAKALLRLSGRGGLGRRGLGSLDGRVLDKRRVLGGLGKRRVLSGLSARKQRKTSCGTSKFS